MKYFTSCIILLLMLGCSKDVADSEQAVMGSTSIAHFLFSEFLEDYNNDVNALVNVSVVHFFQSESTSSSSSIRIESAFGVDEPDAKVGIVTLNPFGDAIIKSGIINSFSEGFFCCDDLPSSGPYMVDFESDSDEYDSFQQEIDIDFGHVVTANLESDTESGNRVLNTSEDFELNWTESNEDEEIYFYLCASDTPCIKKEIVDKGTIIIEKEEMKDLSSGKNISMYLLKVKQYCLRSRGNDICINSINYSRPGPTIVK